MEIIGACHCGAIHYQLEWPGEPRKIPARACACGYCTRFGGNWTSHPDAMLHVEVNSPEDITLYRFGTKTADFVLCSHCGVKLFALSAIDENLYAVVNANTFLEPVSLDQGSGDFDGESKAQRLQRRSERWIKSVNFPGYESISD